MAENGALKRRPQLADSIQKLDEMVDGLATAIPGAVAESVREVLGPALAAAITDAVRDAVKEAVAEAVKQAVAELAAKMPSVPAPPTPPPPPPAPPKPGVWEKVTAALARWKKGAGRKVAPAVARLALGWGVMRLIGGSTVRSRTATAVTALTGTLAGLVGVAAGPVGSAVLLGLATGVIAATAVWAAPAAQLLVAVREG